MATTTCAHGQQAGSCLICATLNDGQVVTRPAIKPEVLRDRVPRRGHRLGALGVLVVVAAALVVAWFLIHLVWGVLRLIELGLVGVVCGYVGFKVGVVVGRHRR